MNSHSLISRIPVELIVRILSLLPLLSLYKARCVSKLWHSLITNLVLPNTTQSPFIGFFHYIISERILTEPLSKKGMSVCNANVNAKDIFKYTDTRYIGIIDPTLPFLPRPLSSMYFKYEISILDGCNGLLICDWENNPRDLYYVCNPATRSWDELRDIDCREPQYMLLDFDPRVSPRNYKVVTVLVGVEVLIKVYSSETRRWERKRVVDCEVDFVPNNGGSGGDRHCALWNGAVYVFVFCRRFEMEVEERWKTMRFRPLEGEAVHKEVVGFPTGTEMPITDAFIGRSRDKLCFAGLDGPRIRVWSLSSKHDNEWVMEHESIIYGIHRYDTRDPPFIVGFHPLLNAVLILYKREVFVYDLKEMSLDGIFRIGSNDKANMVALVYPYSLCLSYFLKNRNA